MDEKEAEQKILDFIARNPKDRIAKEMKAIVEKHGIFDKADKKKGVRYADKSF